MTNPSASRDALPLSPTSPFAPRAGTARVAAIFHHGPRKGIDAAFLKFLEAYAARDPECPALFKAFLEDVVLGQGEGDLRSRVEAYLRNPEIKDYRLGTRFLRELAKYSIFDQLFPAEGEPVATPPSIPIPEQYRPNAQPTSGHSIDLESVIEPPEVALEEEPDEEREEIETEGQIFGISSDEDERARARQPPRVSSILTGLRRHMPGAGDPMSATSTTGEGRAGQFLGEHGALFQRLQAIRTFPRTEDFDAGDETMDRTGPDWEVDSWYKGSRQPPLAARLDTVVKFLAEEDVDRCLNWEAKFEEVVSYLEWLADKDDRHQLDNASPWTQAMFNDAVNKAKAHVLFEEHHYNPTPLEITRPRKHPLKSTRLKWMIDGQDWPLPSRTSVPDRSTLLPRSITARPPGTVNKMLIDKPDNAQFYEQFAEDEKKWWQRIAGTNLARLPSDAENRLERDNLAYIEDQAFQSFSSDNTAGWIRTDPATGQTTLPDGTALDPSTPQSWAKERGACRAGLQQLLRALPTNSTTDDLNTPWRRLILPVPAATLLKACERADGPQWTPPSLDRAQLPEQIELDPMASTVAYRDRLRKIKRTRQLALMQVEDEQNGEGEGDGRPGTLLPRNLVNGGPIVGRLLDAEAKERRDLLRRCRSAVEMLKVAYRKVPRPLLKAALRLVGEGEKGDARVPEGVRLRGDEWEEVGRERLPKLVDLYEVEWLVFLTGPCVNGKNWRRRFVPDTPRDKYRLFLIFANKVQKLLEDRNPDGLFSRHDAQVEVEDLLAAINAGKDSSAVTKHEFQPHDACCWLDRMQKTGHVRFRLDPMCYGVVQRPEAKYFPEHRVFWRDGRDRPDYEDVTDWFTAICGRGSDISEGSPIWNFFASLAFRLGYTISALSADHPVQATPAAARTLRDSLTKWKRACADHSTTTPAEPTAQELATIRTNIINELSANNPMLHPARAHHFFPRRGRAVPLQTAFVRDHNWDWASLEVRNQPARRQYWSINRWPLGVGYLSERAERAVREDEHLDPAVTYDPVVQDVTTEGKYLRPKLRPYRQEKTVFRPGPAIYAGGDTRLQRERLKERMVEMVGRAIGLEGQRKRTWSGTLASFNPFSRPSSRAGDRKEEDRLPPVDLKAVPKSWDPLEEAEPQDVDDEMEPEYASEEGIGEDFEFQDVDVPMAGMGESWMTA